MRSNGWHSGIMVGRFNVRCGEGESGWFIWDNAANGNRGSGLPEQDAHDQAADLELQYDAHGYRAASTVRHVDPAVPVEAFQPVGELDAWIHENGEWIGRICCADGRYLWIRGSDLRRAEPT